MNNISLQHTLPNVFAERDSVVSDVWQQNLEFKKGGIYLVEADSGTGKSSLCSFIYGYRNDYQGKILFGNENIRSLSVSNWVDIRKNSLSMLFQDMRLFGELTAMENILLKNNLTHYKTKQEIEGYFETMGIPDKLDAKVRKLSFGQQQRVAFIRSLCQPFDFIFLDEPISHLDETNGQIMGELLMQEVNKQGAGIIVTSIGKHIELDYNKIFKL
ncbi:ATP-binding cassette domain-containing protein [Bacteroides sedimenti]|uniref:ABC transporter ATP-binding protein n=1 Tax=Bacteroides sedimenti TaxID=2136147 RepID=A0ABM8IDY3_9BACE